MCICNIDVRDGGGISTAPTYNADAWTNVWLVVDNTADTTTPYTSAGADDPSHATTGGFCNMTTDALVTRNRRAGNNHSGNDGFLDDAYMSSGVNLTHPVTIP